MPYAVPTEIKRLRGTDQPCRLIPNEPQPPDALSLEPPDCLSATQRGLWTQIITDAPPHLLRTVDVGVLLQYVVARDLFTRATEELNRDGYIQLHKNRKTVHPAVYVLNSQAVTMRQCEQELGFTPASRTRINTLSDAMGGRGADDDSHWQQIAMSYG